MVSPFPAGDHKVARIRQDSMTDTHETQITKKDPQKKHHQGSFSKKIARGLNFKVTYNIQTNLYQMVRNFNTNKPLTDGIHFKANKPLSDGMHFKQAKYPTLGILIFFITNVYLINSNVNANFDEFPSLTSPDQVFWACVQVLPEQFSQLH